MELAINLTAIIISTIALLTSIAALVMVIAMKISTHKVEFRPLEIKDPFDTEDFKSFSEPSDDLVEEALKLSKEGKERKKKVDKDPLDEILESNNF
jgi:hypothetical protein